MFVTHPNQGKTILNHGYRIDFFGLLFALRKVQTLSKKDATLGASTQIKTYSK